METRKYIRRHKLKITPATLAAYKAARRRELVHRGKPVPGILLPAPAGQRKPEKQ